MHQGEQRGWKYQKFAPKAQKHNILDVEEGFLKGMGLHTVQISMFWFLIFDLRREKESTVEKHKQQKA